MESYTFPTTKQLHQGSQIVWYLVGFIEVVLAFRFVLKFLGANGDAGFTGLIYAITNPLTIGFVSVFNMSQLDGSLFEWTTLLAMAVYALVGWGIVRLLMMSKTVTSPRTVKKLV